jgi:dihydropteridine reductase
VLSLPCSSGPVDAVVCASGGWTGGGAGDKPDALVTAVHQMTTVCLEPAITAAHIACKMLSPTGVLVLVGSEAAVHPTPGMLAYGMAKAATHHLLVSVSTKGNSSGVGAEENKRDPNTLPPQARAIGVLPKVLDTPNNRKWMAKGADTSTWTPLEDVADKIAEWAQEGKSAATGATGKSDAVAVPSGSLVVPETSGGKTVWKVLPRLYSNMLA